MSLAAGLVLALLSALALNWSFVAQHGAASGLPPLSLRRPAASLASLFRNRRWLAGFVTGLAGWALYVGALALAPLSLVQAVAAGGLGVLALLARAGGERLTRRSRAAVALAVVGLLLLAASLAGGVPTSGPAALAPLGLWVAASALGAALLAGPVSPLLAGGAGLGAASGIFYAAGDVLTKSAVGGGARLLVVPAVLAAHGLAFAALQLGFQRGGALATAGVSTVFTNALPIAAGIALYGDGLPSGLLGVARVAAFVCVVAGAALLAQRETGPATASVRPARSSAATAT